MKILFVYPEYPDTFWSFKHALKFIGKKAAYPPLGTITVAAMLPKEWEMKLIDMNVTKLKDGDIKWADYVFISAMAIQKESAKEVIARAKELSVKIVAGGPLFTTEPEQFEEVEHMVLNEAEVTLPLFLSDLKAGNAKHIYTSQEHPLITKTPVPLWSLINMSKYSCMNIQYSRGCPFNCEFCDIVFLDGLNPRTKTKNQVLAELEELYDHGWRGGVFFVDDNFIGNKFKLKKEILPEIAKWQEKKKHPFAFSTEASVNLSDDEELMDMMVKAGFGRIFVGIETPNEESLQECNKNQNRGRDLAASVKTLQNHGLEVMGGFIVGFDSDPLSIFKSQINFIQKTGIVSAMVGLLNAPKGTRLYQRLMKENRLIKSFTGDNMDFSLNFVPKMNRETLIAGYKNILNTIYSYKHYYERIKVLLREYRPRSKSGSSQIHFHHFLGFINTTWTVGIWEGGRFYYWKAFFTTLFTHPKFIPLFVSLSAYGYHFRAVVKKSAKA